MLLRITERIAAKWRSIEGKMTSDAKIKGHAGECFRFAANILDKASVDGGAAIRGVSECGRTGGHTPYRGSMSY
jgi:hypothetical protein